MRTILQWPAWLVLLFILATLVHELGHGLTALALGGEFNHLYIFPGVELWPELGKAYSGFWPGNVALTFFRGGTHWQEWQVGLTLFMGSGSTLLLSFVAVFLLWWLEPRRILEKFLVTLSFGFLDMLLYIFLPMIGLRHIVFIGGDKPEPLLGAMRMGFPPGFSLAVVLLASLLIFGVLVFYLFSRSERF